MLNYEEYKLLMNRQLKKKDVRERVFQDNVIRPFLQVLLTDYDIEPVDVKINSSEHDYTQYCGTYVKNGIEITATPDLCISDNWNWENRKNIVNYKCVVEIKSPILDPITGFEPSKYRCLEEVKRHLNAKKNSKVILTDGITWTFYERELNPIIASICLGNLDYRLKSNSNRKKTGLERSAGGRPIIYGIKWKCGEKQLVDNEVILELFGKLLEYEKEIKEFIELKEQLIRFVTE